ncbi:somatostatin receptor type 5-like [Lytechinus variegatus]|uniref:somatostatin receptor type 5-like n=1 Tax=Lytechinus variegatus TaxID=7654 RepID=UPI001BB19045|nr:somatostatin receptor type 5-like [Lytechinus variegatus]
MYLTRLVEMYLYISIAMSLEALSLASSATTENTWGTSVSSTDILDATDQGFALEEDNSDSLKSPNDTLHEELDDRWDITTVSFEYTVDDTTKVGPWSWYPISWTWVTFGELFVGLVGIIGNLLVIIVLFQRRANSRSTDTLIGALAVADLFTSIALLPVQSAKTVPVSLYGQVYCKLVWLPMCLWIWTFMSGFVLTAISVERYIAVTHPIYFNRILTRRRVSEVVVFLWILSMLICIPGTFRVDVDKVNRRCEFLEIPYEVDVAFSFYVTMVQSFIPTIIMAVTQTLIAIKLKAQSKRFEGSKSHHLAASRAVIKMMFIVIIAYIVCWTPTKVLFLITTVFRSQTELESPISKCFLVLAALNSSINPIIYSIRYQEFRSAVRDLIVGGKVQSKAMFDDPIVNTDTTNDGSA